MNLQNNLVELVISEGLAQSRLNFRLYNPREENLISRLDENELYYLATGSYLPKLVTSYKARCREMNLQFKVKYNIFTFADC